MRQAALYHTLRSVLIGNLSSPRDCIERLAFIHDTEQLFYDAGAVTFKDEIVFTVMGEAMRIFERSMLSFDKVFDAVEGLCPDKALTQIHMQERASVDMRGNTAELLGALQSAGGRPTEQVKIVRFRTRWSSTMANLLARFATRLKTDWRAHPSVRPAIVATERLNAPVLADTMAFFRSTALVCDWMCFKDAITSLIGNTQRKGIGKFVKVIVPGLFKLGVVNDPKAKITAEDLNVLIPGLKAARAAAKAARL